MRTGITASMTYLAIVRDGRIAVLQICEHDDPVVRPLRSKEVIVISRRTCRILVTDN